jgi:hypothetical protein
LIGCTHVPEFLQIDPPAELLQPCPEPAKPAMTSQKDVALWATDLFYAHQACAAKVDGLRGFWEKSSDK